MNRDTFVIQQHLNTAWDAVRSALHKMYPSSDVRPRTGYEIFRPAESTCENEIKFSVQPIVFNLPERAKQLDANLYIAVEGWLSFEGPNFRAKPLLTKSFGTSVGYFRSKRSMLEHVYGAHYDLDEHKPGHPVFHAQIRSQMHLVAHVNGSFQRDWEADDMVAPILRSVRTPSAQMDVFSVIAQICADHLIYEHSGPEVHQAFMNMRETCNFFIGAAYRMAYLNSSTASKCYRSTHWYAGTR